MKLIIEGREYDLTEAIARPAMGDLVDLKRATKGLEETVSIRTITDAVVDLGNVFVELGDEATVGDVGEAMLDYFDSVEHLLAFTAMVFLCRRTAGEPCTWDDASRVSPRDVQVRVEVEVDDEDGADPKAPSTPAGDESGEVQPET